MVVYEVEVVDGNAGGVRLGKCGVIYDCHSLRASSISMEKYGHMSYAHIDVLQACTACAIGIGSFSDQSARHLEFKAVMPGTGVPLINEIWSHE